MKNMFLKKLVTAVSLSLAVVLGASSVASAYPGDDYHEYDDGHGGILRHWSRVHEGSERHLSAETECHRHGRWIGSYTRTFFEKRWVGGRFYDSGRCYCGDGTFSHAESRSPNSFIWVACTNCGPKDA